MTWLTTRHFERKKQSDAYRACAYSLVFKIQFYADEIWKIHREIRKAVLQAEKIGLEGELWSKLPEIVGLHQNPSPITSEELALVAMTKDLNMVMKLRALEAGHSVLVQSLSKIHQLRATLANSAKAVSADGRTVSYGGSPEDFLKISPILTNLSDTSNGLEELAERIAVNADMIANNVGDLIKSHYKFGNFVTLEARKIESDEELREELQ